MRSQITAMTQNLIWTRSGVVWAVYRLTPLPYGFRSEDKKREVRSQHTALLRVLRGEALMLGICSTTDPAAVVERMIRGVDLDSHPQWAEECEATLDHLETIELGGRSHWLAVPLANQGTSRWREPLRAAVTGLRDSLAMPRSGPPPASVTDRLAQAEQFRQALPGVFRPRPASVAEMVWLHLHAQQRGLALDLGDPGPGSTEETLMASVAAIAEPILDPAGQTDLQGRSPLAGLNLLGRRYVKVINTDTGQASYQSSLVMTGTPAGGIAFPGGEWLGDIDVSGEEVDWALRLNIRSREEVTQRNVRASRNLNDQLYQREGASGDVPSELGLAAADLAAYRDMFVSDDLEVEVESTAIFTVGAPTADECLAAARRVADHYAQAQFSFSLDATAQEDLWWAGLPGPAPRIVRETSQISPSHHFAAAVPLTTTEIGDAAGALVAIGLSTGRPLPVLVDVAGSSRDLDVAPAVAAVGQLGCGKSFFLKKCSLDALDRGAEVVAIDRTVMGEWGKAVAGIDGALVVEVSENAQFSLDPLRVFGPRVGPRIAQSFLTALLRVPANSEGGAFLSDILDPTQVQTHRIDSLGALLSYLEGSKHPLAPSLASKMRVFARKDFGRAVFDQDLPPVPLRSRALVFWTHQLELPDKDELNIAHRFEEMKLEKIFGRAVYALIAEIGREKCFSDPRRLALFVNDEAHGTTQSPEGLAVIKGFLRDGRKHLAALLLGSHDPEDFGDEVLRGLIAFRVLMRHRDRTLAARGLRWLQGLPENAPVDEELLVLVSEQTSPVEEDELGRTRVRPERRGECLIRDFRARIGRAKVLAPNVPARALALDTTPGQETAA